MNAERAAVFIHGPRFFTGIEGGVMFEFVIDASNIHGPREATDADKDKYPDAYKAYQAECLAASETADAVEGDGSEGAGEADGEGGTIETDFSGDPGNPHNPRVIKKKKVKR